MSVILADLNLWIRGFIYFFAHKSGTPDRCFFTSEEAAPSISRSMALFSFIVMARESFLYQYLFYALLYHEVYM